MNEQFSIAGKSSRYHRVQVVYWVAALPNVSWSKAPK